MPDPLRIGFNIDWFGTAESGNDPNPMGLGVCLQALLRAMLRIEFEA